MPNYQLTAAFLLPFIFFPINAAEISTTTAEQSHLHVTIYNSDLALIKDTRKLKLPAGLNTLNFKGVSAKIRPETAILTAPGVSLLEQNFEYDLLTPAVLMDKFVGRKVTLERWEGDKVIKESAKILANNHGAVVQVGNQIRTLTLSDGVVFDDVPADLRDRPTLTMLIDNDNVGEKDVSLSYLSNNLNWKADYVMELNYDETLSLKGLVTLNNNSGIAYENANLQLVAGDVNRVPKILVESMLAASAMKKARVVPDMASENLFEYHLYTLARPTTIRNKQQKQVSLLQAGQVPYQKELVIIGNEPYDWQMWRADTPAQKLKATAKLLLKNTKANHLGLPMPAGVIRTYQKDDKGNIQFIGEDRITHTAENENLTLTLGKSFDVSAMRKQIDTHSERLASKSPNTPPQTKVTATYEIIFNNAKAEATTVHYKERFMGNWQIQTASLPSEKQSATINSWQIKIPAKSKKTLRYTVEMVF